MAKTVQFTLHFLLCKLRLENMNCVMIHVSEITDRVRSLPKVSPIVPQSGVNSKWNYIYSIIVYCNHSPFLNPHSVCCMCLNGPLTSLDSSVDINWSFMFS